MNILQICFRVPYPPTDGGAIAMFGITKGLSDAGHKVTVLAINTPKHFQKEDALQGIADLKTVFIDTRISFLGAFLNLFKSVPYILERFFSLDFENSLKKLLEQQNFDVIHFEGTYTAKYIDVVSKITKTPTVFRSHNLEYLIWDRLATVEKNPFKAAYYNFTAKGLRKFEKQYLNKFDLVLAITLEDQQRMRDLGVSGKIEFLPAGVDPDRFPLRPEIVPQEKSCFILSALNWIPNQQGLFWFLQNVWPQLLIKVPGIKLHIAGKGTTDEIKHLENDNIIVHGFVEDAGEFMQKYDLMLVPLLSGGGMRLKIIEGMMVQKVIVSSPVGAEGINCTDGKNILICEKSEDWVNSISNYFKSPSEYKFIGENAASLIREKYYNTKVIDKLVSFYLQLNK